MAKPDFKLNIREQLLIPLLLDPKLTKKEAGIRAGYSERSANQQVHDVLKKPNVKRALDYEFEKIQEKVRNELTLNEVALLNELAYLATSDVSKLYDENGYKKSIAELDKATQRAIQSYEVEESGTAKSKKVVHKYKMYDKLTAIRLYMQYYGMLKDVVVDEREKRTKESTPAELHKQVTTTIKKLRTG